MERDFLNLINKFITEGRDAGLYHIPFQNETFDGKNVTVNKKNYMFWGSCSYMGLETDRRLKDASIDAIERFGTQFSHSRTGLYLPLYDELEDLLTKIFGHPALVAPTTTLAHISAIPVLLRKSDAVIIDQRVHNSVRNALQLAKVDGVYMEQLKHNRMDMLETRIQILSQNHDKVWYFIDGVYSTYGDLAPYAELKYFLEKYENFYLYVDDAHGMGWAGEKGVGTAIRDMGWNRKMIQTSSMAKGYGSCGGVLVFDSIDDLNLVRNCGSSFIFSGPLQPATLASSIAAANICLSDDFTKYQLEINEKMQFFIDYCKELGLPLVSTDFTPIFYIGVGSVEVLTKMTKFLMTQGHFVTNMVFPVVPVNNSGFRLCLTRHHTIEDIKEVLDMIADALYIYLKEEGTSMEEIYNAFGITELQQ